MLLTLPSLTYIMCMADGFASLNCICLFTDMGVLSFLAGSEVPFILARDCYAPDGGSGTCMYM